jgi:DNA-binding NtrC family response regulator
MERIRGSSTSERKDLPLRSRSDAIREEPSPGPRSVTHLTGSSAEMRMLESHAREAMSREVAARLPEPSSLTTELRSLARVEWDYIQQVLALHQGNVSAAARALGIHRRSLQRKLRRSAPPP